MRNTKVKMLPKSIRKLQNLETLDLGQSLVHEIAAEINRLLKLRSLSAYNSDLNVHYSSSKTNEVKEKEIGCLNALRTLYFIEANVRRVNLFKELRMLTQLRKLGIV